MAHALPHPLDSENLRSLIRQLGMDSLDVHQMVFSEPSLLPSTINADAEALCQDRTAAHFTLHDLLSGEEPPRVQLFYERLEKLSVLLTHCPSRVELLGIFLSVSYRRWNAAGELLLVALNGTQYHISVAILPGLPRSFPFRERTFRRVRCRVVGRNLGSLGQR